MLTDSHRIFHAEAQSSRRKKFLAPRSPRLRVSRFFHAEYGGGCSLHALDQAAGLAGAAKVGDALVGAHQGDGRAAARAGLAGLHMDC
jgi:hypothetical protein